MGRGNTSIHLSSSTPLSAYQTRWEPLYLCIRGCMAQGFTWRVSCRTLHFLTADNLDTGMYCYRKTTMYNIAAVLLFALQPLYFADYVTSVDKKGAQHAPLRLYNIIYIINIYIYDIIYTYI